MSGICVNHIKNYAREEYYGRKYESETEGGYEKH
jgi:hypothetical protein